MMVEVLGEMEHRDDCNYKRIEEDIKANKRLIAIINGATIARKSKGNDMKDEAEQTDDFRDKNL